MLIIKEEELANYILDNNISSEHYDNIEKLSEKSFGSMYSVANEIFNEDNKVNGIECNMCDNYKDAKEKYNKLVSENKYTRLVKEYYVTIEENENIRRLI